MALTILHAPAVPPSFAIIPLASATKETKIPLGRLLY